MLNRIAVAVHGADDQSRDALALGVSLARAAGADLVLGAIWVSPLGPGDGLFESIMRSETEREAAVLHDEVPSEIACTVDVRGSTSVARGMHKIATEHAVDLIVVGPSHLGRAARWLRGDVAVNTLRDAPCAVAVAPAGQRDRAGRPAVVMVAWDETPESEAALVFGADLAERSDAELRLVHVIDSPFAYNTVPYFEADGHAHYLHSIVEERRRALGHAADQVADRVRVSCELREGMVREELVSAAVGADIAIFGSRAYGPLARVVLGSTSSSFLKSPPCPVLVLPRGVRAPAAQPA